MTNRFKVLMACFLALALVATLCLNCAEEEEEEKVTIVIGHLTDLTGVAAPALIPISKAFDANVEYFNEENIIPGVELKIVRWNSMYDIARAIPGFDWLRDQGATIIYTEMPEMAEPLIPFAKRDKTPVICHPGTVVLAEALGWAFCLNPTSSAQMRGVMKYIADEWDYEGMGRKPKIGTAGWSTPYGNEVKLGAEYCLDHPDKFDYVGSYMAPAGVVSWAGEVEKLKNCDYIVLTTPGALQPATFAAEFQAKGYKAKFIGLDSLMAFWDFLLDNVGGEALDEALIGQYMPLWVFDNWVVDHLKDLAYRYYPDEADTLIYSNNAWLGGGAGTYFILECLREAIEEVGPENFDGEAFYNTAVDFRPDWEGFPEIGWGPTERLASRWQMIYEYSYEAGDFALVTGWVEVIEE